MCGRRGRRRKQYLGMWMSEIKERVKVGAMMSSFQQVFWVFICQASFSYLYLLYFPMDDKWESN